MFILQCSVVDFRFTESLWISSLIHLKSNWKVIFFAMAHPLWLLLKWRSTQISATHQNYENHRFREEFCSKNAFFDGEGRIPKHLTNFWCCKHFNAKRLILCVSTSITRCLTISIQSPFTPVLVHIACLPFRAAFIASTLILWLKSICVSFHIFAVFSLSKLKMGCCAIYIPTAICFWWLPNANKCWNDFDAIFKSMQWIQWDDTCNVGF